MLGPVFFLLYTADVITVARRTRYYADDTQLCQRSVAKMCVASIPRLVSCIDNINRWMSSLMSWSISTGGCRPWCPGRYQQVDVVLGVLVDINRWMSSLVSWSISTGGCRPWCTGRYQQVDVVLGVLVDINRCMSSLVSWSISTGGCRSWCPGRYQQLDVVQPIEVELRTK